MKKGYLYFHQGWTDILCQLSLVNYYYDKYDIIKVVMRDDAKELFDYYIRNLKNVIPIYIETDNGRHINNKFLSIENDYEIIFHGHHDTYRDDEYRNSFVNNSSNGKHFMENFYHSYNIDYNTKIEYFNLDRDIDLENSLYEKFKQEHGENYVIYHDDEMNHIHGPYSIPTKIDFKNKNEDWTYINLNKRSFNFFDYITIIKNAKEIHLVDSVWAAMCYQIDTKYGLLSDKQINLYAKREHHDLFTNPIKLNNWNII
jgi:hypothetical protein